MAESQSSTSLTLPWGQSPSAPQRNANDCGPPHKYVDRYPIKLAAALWCNIPDEELQFILDTANEIGRNIFSHQMCPCLEPKCRAIHAAIDAGMLPVYREQGGRVPDHVAPDRRHVMRHELKAWIVQYHPDEKPPALFDEVE